MLTWWITDGPLPEANKIAGSYASFDDAVAARVDVERENVPATYWIDSEQDDNEPAHA